MVQQVEDYCFSELVHQEQVEDSHFSELAHQEQVAGYHFSELARQEQVADRQLSEYLRVEFEEYHPSEQLPLEHLVVVDHHPERRHLEHQDLPPEHLDVVGHHPERRHLERLDVVDHHPERQHLDSHPVRPAYRREPDPRHRYGPVHRGSSATERAVWPLQSEEELRPCPKLPLCDCSHRLSLRDLDADHRPELQL